MFWKKTNHKRCFSFMCVGICGYYREEFGDKYFINTQQRLGKNSEYRRLLNPRSCNGICLDPSCPRTTDQLEPAEEVKGVWKTRKRGERAKAAQKRRRFQFNWKRFGIIPKWNNGETGNTITPAEKCVNQVVSSLAMQSHSSEMNSSFSQRRWGWLVSQKVWSEDFVLWGFERDSSTPQA